MGGMLAMAPTGPNPTRYSESQSHGFPGTKSIVVGRGGQGCIRPSLVKVIDTLSLSGALSIDSEIYRLSLLSL